VTHAGQAILLLPRLTLPINIPRRSGNEEIAIRKGRFPSC